MRHYWLTSDAPDLPANAFKRGLGRNRPATLEGGGKGGDSPAPPDPWQTAAATTFTNQQSAAYNKALNLNNYTNPFGSQQTTQVGKDPNTGAPIYNTSITANPQLQGMLTGLLGQAGQSSTINQNAMNGLSGLAGQYQGINDSLSALRSSLNPQMAQQAQQQGQNAAYAAQTQYLDPQFSQQKTSLDAQLANQGLTQGSEAYNNAQNNFALQKQRAYSDAANQSILTGSQIGSQNLQNQIAGLQSQSGLLGMMGQNLGQQAGLYGQQVGIGQVPYSNIQSIAQMIPGYSGTGQSAAAPADIGGYMNNAYQGQLANHNADVSSANSTMGTIGSVAGIAAMAMGF
ncbi:tail fiber domain-containing protein [Burkholderia sp. B21-007]|uniref:tail fiber domain-containing protein n=1 Tax=Burkholderia sp. B21-007 TaxID=2890407 RepID=UPI001E3D53EE|nr:tail fiber domain-containing protein [Burkholderia sp. B21-007]UEP31615.1 tail fiber domain-containing protein [Burkholderia sp. B21-007]